MKKHGFLYQLPFAAVAGFLLGSLLLSCGQTERMVRIGVIADCQYCDCPEAGSRFYRNSTGKLQTAVDTFNTHDLDLIFHLGDFIDRNLDSFDPVNAVLHQSKAPVHHVLGNHDYSVDDREKARVPDLLGMPARYYKVSEKGWEFIVLDGNDLSYQAYPSDSVPATVSEMFDRVVERDRPNAYKWNGGIGNDQVTWLVRQLDEAEAKGKKVVLLCHFPIYPAGAHNLWNDEEMADLIEPYNCVKLWMNGHNHAGAYDVQKGIHYITLEGMVETTDQNAFAIVELKQNQLDLHGFGRVKDLLLDLK